MKEIIAHIKEKQKEYNTESAAYRVLRELEVTLPSLFAEDKKAPVLNQDKIELIFVGIETMMFSAFLQGKENGQFKNWYERNGMKESFKRTLEEYLKLKK